MADTVGMAATDITRRLVAIIWDTRTGIDFNQWLHETTDLLSSQEIADRIAEEIPEITLSARTIRRWLEGTRT